VGKVSTFLLHGKIYEVDLNGRNIKLHLNPLLSSLEGVFLVKIIGKLKGELSELSVKRIIENP